MKVLTEAATDDTVARSREEGASRRFARRVAPRVGCDRPVPYGYPSRRSLNEIDFERTRPVLYGL